MKIISHIIILAFFPLILWGQKDLPIPPKAEKTTHFSFKQFERQPTLPKYISTGISNLAKKNIRKWKATDSLFYAYELTLLNEFEHALSYFIKLNTDTLRNRSSLNLYQLTLRKTDRFQTLLGALKRENDLNNLTTIEKIALTYRIRLAEVRLYNRDRNWSLDSNHVFPSLLDSSTFTNEYSNINQNAVHTSKGVDQALRHELLFTEGTDKILSKAYEEFGDFLQKHMYLTNAYVAYSISRHFNRRKNSVSKKFKNIKNQLDDQNLLYPSFSSLFPKIIESKYTYNEIKELDSLDLSNTQHKYLDLKELLELENAKKDHLPWLDYELGVILIIGILLFFVLFFLRSKKDS